MRTAAFRVSLILFLAAVPGGAHGAERVIGPGLLRTGQLFVAAGNTLRLLPGAELEFLPGTGLLAEGALIAEGTAELPVVLRGAGWIGVRCAAVSPSCRMRHVRIDGPAELAGTAPFLAESTLLGPVRFHGAGSMQTSDLRITSTDRSRPALEVLGEYDRLQLRRFTFRVPSLPDGSRLDILAVTGRYNRLYTEEIRSERCLLTQARFMPTEYGEASDACPPLRLPVLFVPGIGTSFNVGALASPAAAPADTVWTIPKVIAPAYHALFAQLDRSGIQYGVAPYDWRRPARESAATWLMPALDRLTAATGSRRVRILAHSFGGIVSRAYVQGEGFRGEVASLTTLGTPHAGAAKAYPIWAAGQLPPDWSPVRMLLRAYRWRDRSLRTDRDALRTAVPSVAELLPAYEALQREGFPLERLAVEPNPLLPQLNRNMHIVLSGRVELLYLFSSDRPTAYAWPVRSGGRTTKTGTPPKGADCTW